MIETILSQLDLSEKEIKVYLEIVKTEGITVTALAKKTMLHRPTVYDIITTLIQKGLISQVIKAKKKSFQPTDFTKLISTIKEKEQLAYLAIEELAKLQQPSKDEYRIEVFEGIEGMKSYFDYLVLLCKSKQLKDYLVLGSNLNIVSNIKLFLLPRIKELSSLITYVDFRIIWSHMVNDNLLKASVDKIAKYKYLPKGFGSNSTTVIFNEYIALFLHVNKPVIVRIKNKELAQTYRNYFNLLWKIC